MDRLRLFAAYRRGEHAVKIGAVQRQVREPVARHGDGTQVEELPGLAAAPESDFLPGRLAGQRRERLSQSERVQRARPVGADLHPGADVAERARLLVDIDVDAAPEKRERCRQPADAGAGEQHVRRRPQARAVLGAEHTSPAPTRHTPSRIWSQWSILRRPRGRERRHRIGRVEESAPRGVYLGYPVVTRRRACSATFPPG